MAKPTDQEIQTGLEKQAEESNTALTLLYGGSVNIGTEEMGSEDLNTPILKIIQSNTQGIEYKQEGFFYRSDTNQTLESVKVNLIYVTTQELENYNKTGLEKVKVYYGVYDGTFEPFKMFLRGWNLASHRDFQGEVSMIKRKHQVPMLALSVNLTTDKQAGTIADTGKPYTIYKIKFNIDKEDVEGNPPVVQEDSDRVKFLLGAYEKCKSVVSRGSDRDQQQSDREPF